MTASSYDEALRRVLVHEGGYSNHPSDPGGPTNWGITIHDARAYWKKEATAADVRSMPVHVARDISGRSIGTQCAATIFQPGSTMRCSTTA
jgi:lysozyme family protein